MPMSPRLLRPIASGVHPEAAAWRSAVVANGGSVSASTMKAVSTFCAAIDAAGIRDRFYRLNLFCGNSDASLIAPRVPLYRGPSRTGTQYGNALDTNNNFVQGDYQETGASGGLKGNSVNKYLATGLPMNYPDTNGDRHIAVYKNAVATSTDYSLGVNTTASPATLYQLVRISTSFYYFSGGNTLSINAADATGFWQATGTVNRTLYKDGVSVASNTNGSDTVNTETTPFFVFARNNAGSPDGHSDERQAAYSIGLSMDATEAANYYTALQAFQTALGRNV